MTTKETRINQKIDEIKSEHGSRIIGLLKEVNQTRLKGKGKVIDTPTIDRNNVRWTLAWKEGSISFDLNVVVSIEDDGKQSRVGKVWIHRHAASSLDFDGHTPTTRMKRLTSLSLGEIRQAIEVEFN